MRIPAKDIAIGDWVRFPDPDKPLFYLVGEVIALDVDHVRVRRPSPLYSKKPRLSYRACRAHIVKMSPKEIPVTLGRRPKRCTRCEGTGMVTVPCPHCKPKE